MVATELVIEVLKMEGGDVEFVFESPEFGGVVTDVSDEKAELAFEFGGVVFVVSAKFNENVKGIALPPKTDVAGDVLTSAGFVGLPKEKAFPAALAVPNEKALFAASETFEEEVPKLIPVAGLAVSFLPGNENVKEVVSLAVGAVETLGSSFFSTAGLGTSFAIGFDEITGFGRLTEKFALTAIGALEIVDTGFGSSF